jgi:hypothetical protein
MIEAFGGRVTGSVSGKTSYLVIGKSPGASKVGCLPAEKGVTGHGGPSRGVLVALSWRPLEGRVSCLFIWISYYLARNIERLPMNESMKQSSVRPLSPAAAALSTVPPCTISADLSSHPYPTAYIRAGQRGG